MSDLEYKEKRKKQFKRNLIAKYMFENKGAFAIKAVNPKKGVYKRKKLRVNEIDNEDMDG